ncbi:YopX family protein [Dellaglioa sp. BT-FLS60]
MQDIRFREWDPEREKMYGKGSGMSYSDREEFDDTTSFRFAHEEDLDYSRRQIEIDKYSTPFRELMQYTGLNDSKGVPIYEGDIVRNEDNKRLFLIRYKGGSFLVGRYYFGSIGAGKKLEVVGNAFENPELTAGHEYE